MKEITEFLKELLTILQQTKNFAIENAPLIAQQKIQSEIFNLYVLWVSVLVVGLAVFALCLFTYVIKDKEELFDIFEGSLIFSLISIGFFCTYLIFGFGNSVEKYYKLKNTPQLYLLEWVKSELKR